MLYSGFSTLHRSVFWSADFNGRSDNTDVIRLRTIFMNPIAEWNLLGSKNGASLAPVCVALHQPEPDPKSPHGDFRTLVEISGIAKSEYVFGVNSMQSLVLALRVLQIQVELALDDGWIFFFDENHTEPFNLLEAITPATPTLGES